MRRLFVDTNVVLDLLGERAPFYVPAAQLATLADRGKVQLFVSSLTFVTVNYVLSKFESSAVVREKLRKFKIISEICALTESIVEKGLNSSFSDFEDAIQYFSAIDSGCEAIITRNGKDFKDSLIAVMTTDEYLKSIRK